MKLKSGEQLANKNMAIGNLKEFYSNAYESDNQIQVVKDTWALEIPLKVLHDTFFMIYPERMYELFIKPVIFD